MKNLLTIFLFFLVLLAVGQVGVHTDTPDNSSALDIVAANRGLLIPRVTLTSNLSNPSPVTAPAVGLLVFNSGANQAIGFYYWSGSAWTLIGGSGGGGGNDWTLTGNAGTIPGTNFIGTTDNQHFLVKTNNAERMRFESDGQVIIGGTTPSNATDLFTVFGNSTQNAAINAYSPRTGFQTVGGRYGILSTVDTVNGFSYYGRNLDPIGYGMVVVGSNYTTVGLIGGTPPRSAGIHTQGFDGLHAKGKSVNGYGIFAMDSNATNFKLNTTAGLSASGKYGIITKAYTSSGSGIVAVGSNWPGDAYTSGQSEGGAFTGFHGIYARGIGYRTSPDTIAGIGVIGVGYRQSSYSALAHGISSGGAFSGDYGVYGKGLNATDGVGVLGVGSGGSGYYTVTNGSGGAFTGYHGLLGVGVNVAAGLGVVGAGNNSAYVILPQGAGGVFTGITIGAGGFGTSTTEGIGLIGSGNNQAIWVPSNGCGGAFIGNTGIFSRSHSATGTGVVGLGNNLASPGTFASGAGGTFTGNAAGVVGWGVIATGTGIIGVGNNIATPLTHANGSGGAFTGTGVGLVSYGTTAASGVGVIGLGNNITTPGTFANGAGGTFKGNAAGAVGWGATVATGTGIIGVGNNIATPLTYGSGSGGAFTGTAAGAVAYGTTAASGIGVIGLGNAITTAVLPGTSGCGGAFTGATYGVAAYANTAGGSSYGVYGQYNGGGSNDGVGVYGYSAPAASRGYGVRGYGNKYGVLGVQGTTGSTNYGVYATGNLACSGTKTFAIDHPLDPENKILKHFTVESPEVLNMYRGNIILNDEGEATIQLPDYFLEININYSYDMTPVGKPAPDLYIKDEIDNEGKFTIAGGSPNQKISWIVYGERNDLYMRQEGMRDAEIAKEDWEKGKYIMPELYNQPPEKSMFYSEIFNQEIQSAKSNSLTPGTASTTSSVEQPAIINQMTILETKPLETVISGKDHFTQDQTMQTKTLEVKEDQVIELKDDDVK